MKMTGFRAKSLLIFMLFFVSVPVWGAKDYFTTRREKLIDASGQAFVIRGVNNPHAWFREQAFNALFHIQEIGANTVRIVWQTSGQVSELERIVNRCIELEMVPMVELHDVTGSNSKERLLDMAGWYARDDVVRMLRKYERFLLVNIANEWGNNDITPDKWLEAYTEAVNVMRAAGYVSTIVVDAPGWGQNIDPFLLYGRRLIKNDPKHNILLSVHMYGSWNDPDRIVLKLREARKQKLPLIVGEFGYNYAEGDNNLGCKADHRVIMKTCNKLKYGYIPWSWTGNNSENSWLDIVDSRDWRTPTEWGSEVIGGEYGITATSRKARAFQAYKSLY